jgi:hypothetical protein
MANQAQSPVGGAEDTTGLERPSTCHRGDGTCRFTSREHNRRVYLRRGA